MIERKIIFYIIVFYFNTIFSNEDIVLESIVVSNKTCKTFYKNYDNRLYSSDISSKNIILGGIYSFSLWSLLYFNDQKIYSYFDKNNTSFIKNIALEVEKMGDVYFQIPILLVPYTIGYFGNNNKLKATSLLAFESFIISGACAFILKHSLHRARPLAKKGSQEWFTGKNTDDFLSCPSGHACFAFSMASIFTGQYKNPYFVISAYSTAFMTSLSRLYQKKHWSSDVLMGAGLGFLVGKIVLAVNFEELEEGLFLIPSYKKDLFGIKLSYKF